MNETLAAAEQEICNNDASKITLMKTLKSMVIPLLVALTASITTSDDPNQPDLLRMVLWDQISYLVQYTQAERAESLSWNPSIYDRFAVLQALSSSIACFFDSRDLASTDRFFVILSDTQSAIDTLLGTTPSNTGNKDSDSPRAPHAERDDQSWRFSTHDHAQLLGHIGLSPFEADPDAEHNGAAGQLGDDADEDVLAEVVAPPVRDLSLDDLVK